MNQSVMAPTETGGPAQTRGRSATHGARSHRRWSKVRDFHELGKPGLARFTVLTTLAGYYLASVGPLDYVRLVHLAIGSGLAASGTLALNQYWERDVDARMRRTRGRPIPSGRILPSEALAFSIVTSAAGLLYLARLVNPMSSLLVAATLVSYIFIYTPLKRRTTLSTLVGAIPGALPMMAGWTATGRPLELGAWVIFAIMFLWQIPHFLALAWLYREDYRAGGLVMLPVDDEDGVQTARQCFNYTAGLVPVSLLPSVLGLTGIIYFGGALLLGLAFLWVNYNVVRGWTRERARKLFFASITYLPLLFLLMLFDTVRS